jgi:CRISPR-associated protein Cas2
VDVLVTYDIATTKPAGERRLASVAKVCEGYGTRVQYSVFECRVSGTALAKMLRELADEIEPSEDSITIYRFPGILAENRLSLGRGPLREPGQPWII